MREWSEVPPAQREYIDKLVANAPPLSIATLDKLRLLLGPSIRAAAAAEAAEAAKARRA